MKVLIVAKTRQGNGACVGGITFDGRSVRLIAADAETNSRFNHQYEIGEGWDIEGAPPPASEPPHVENLVVSRAKRLGPMSGPDRFVEKHMPPICGGVEALYDG